MRPQLPRKRLSTLKRASRTIKSGIRLALAPVMPWLPEKVASAFPSLGLVSTYLPDGRSFRLISDGHDGKDYIAYKVAGRSVQQHEPETTRVISTLLNNANCFFDVGANTGLYAMLAACKPQCRVIAFEPVPQIASRLQANARLNRFSQVRVEAAAVTNRVGEIVLHIPATKTSLPTSASCDEGFKTETQPVTVPAISLDWYIEHHGIEHVDVMKVDTERTEDLVLAGAEALIRRDEPAIVCEVLYQRSQPAIVPALDRLLRPLGYRFFWITDAGLRETDSPTGDEQEVFNNYLFISPRRLSQIAHLIIDDAHFENMPKRA